MGVGVRYIPQDYTIMKETKEKIIIKYTGKCIKMDDRTWELFKKKRKQSGLSWNRYIYQLIEKKK